MNNNSSQNHHCFSCGKQLDIPLKDLNFILTQFPVCNQTTDTVSIEKHLMCAVCQQAFMSINLFVQTYKPTWFSKQFKLQKIIESAFVRMSHIDINFTKQNRKSQIQEVQARNNSQEQITFLNYNKKESNLNINLPNDIYSSHICENIEENSLHYIFWLPKTVQYLIHLTSTEKTRYEERKERIKNTLKFFSYLYLIDEHQLKYLAILIHSLLCFMDEQYVYKLLDPLLRGLFKNNIPLDIFLIQLQFDDTKDFKTVQQKYFKAKPIDFRPQKLLQTILSILILSDFFRQNKLKKRIQQLINVSFNKQIKKNKIKGSENVFSKQNIFEQYLKKTIPQNSAKVTKISLQNWQSLISIKKQKNYLNLIIKRLTKEQEQNKQIVKDIQNKFKRQKDQYISKIIKLNHKIEELEVQLKNVKYTITNLSDSNLKQKNKQNQDQIKSNPQASTNIKIQQNSQIGDSIIVTQQIIKNSIKKHQSQHQNNQGQQIRQKKIKHFDYLRSILQHNGTIQTSHKSSKKSSSFPLSQIPTSKTQLSQLISSQIDKLEKRLISLTDQNKKLRNQSTQILNILRKKEEKWIPLLQQKDYIISLYQKALIFLEKGYIVPEQPLKSRIKYIIQNITQVKELQLKEDTCLRDSFIQDQSNGSKQRNSNISSKQRTSNKNSNYIQNNEQIDQKMVVKKIKNNISLTNSEKKKKQVKQKQKDSKCIIY